MSEKRRDKNGCVLRNGESQRKNGTYCYRCTGLHKQRQTVYAKTLDELRGKEERVQRDLLDGIDYAAGDVTVSEPVAGYMPMKRGLKTILQPAFEMAIEDDKIRKNPFNFNLSDILPNDAEKRVALTKAQQEEYLRFVRQCDSSYYDEIEILLGTELRVSELYGLTKGDADFRSKCLRVRRHTFCKTYQQAGLDVKNLRYIMGHADASTTPDTYAHSDYESAEAAFRRVLGSA